MRSVAIAIIALLGFAQPASALCKFQGSDGKWHYADSCREMSEKEIDQEAAAVLKRRNEYGTGNQGIEPRRLRGYDYGTSPYGERRVREVDVIRDPGVDARPR